MLPSRGLRWSSQAIGLGRRRIGQTSMRSLSSSPTLKALPRVPNVPSNQISTALKISSRSHLLASRTISPLAFGVRHNSTRSSPNPPTSSFPDAADAAAADISATPLDASLFEHNILDIPEHIGYLKSLGLDYGWGPTGFVEYVLEHIHVYAGTPWWASIALTAILFRVCMTKIYINAADNAARMATVAPLTKPLTTKMFAAQAAGNTAEVMAVRKEVSIINQRAGVKTMRSLMPLIQVPLGFGSFFLLRAMAEIPVPGLESGGLLWWSNLAVYDPGYTIPFATAAIMHLVLRRGGETGVNNFGASTLKLISYGLPTVMFFFTMWMPAGLQWSFLITGVMSATQVTAFRNPAVRKFLGIAPLPDKSTNPFETKPELQGSVYQPRVIVAEKGTYRTTYEAPRSAQATASAKIYGVEPQKPNGMLAKLKKSVGSSIESTRKSMVESLEDASKSLPGYTPPGQKSKQELNKLDAYEKKRREEEERELLERDEIRKQERMARRRKRD